MVLLEAVPAVVVLLEAAVAGAGVLVDVRAVERTELQEILRRRGRRGVHATRSTSIVASRWFNSQAVAHPLPHTAD